MVPSVSVRLAEGAESGLASMVQQLLEQDLGEFEEKRRRAGRMRGRVAMTAADHEVTVTLEFCGDEILVWDGERVPVDASIEGPHLSLLRLLRGETNPLLEHLRGRLRVRSSLRNPFFPLRVHGLMKQPPEGGRSGAARPYAIAGGLIGLVLAAAIAGALLGF